MIYSAVRNSTARKRSELVDPTKMLNQMFPLPKEKQHDKAGTNLLDKFRMLQVQSGGKDYRNRNRKGQN